MKADRPFTDGWRGRIGVVATAPGNATEAYFNSYRPDGVAVLTTRIPLAESTPEGIREMNCWAADAVSMLAKNAYCDIILLSSTAGSFVDGRESDNAFARRLSEENNCMVLSSASCMLRALQAVGAKNVTLITPSSAQLNYLERAYLQNAGITVAAEGGFHLSSPRDILCITADDVFGLIQRCDCPEADAILVSCSGLHMMDQISDIEQAMGKPVLASNQFGLWGCLRALSIDDKITKLGSLWGY